MITDAVFISILFEKIKNQKAILHINIKGVDKKVTSTLFNMDKSGRYLDIDSIKPDSEDRKFYQSKTFKVIVRIQGVIILFESEIIKAIGNKKWHGYRIKFPETIEYRQRRASHRIPIAKNVYMHAVLKQNDHPNITARIENISSEGISLLANHQAFAAVKQDKKPIFCNIAFEDNTKLSCLIQPCRHTELEGDTETRLGARFLGLTFQQSNRLMRQLRMLDRENTRRLVRKRAPLESSSNSAGKSPAS